MQTKFEEFNPQDVVFPEHQREPWSETNSFEFSLLEGNSPIKIATYRYVVPTGTSRKGVIFYIHGYGDYCEHTAFIFKPFADKGYEVFAFDQRGFGNSEGTKGYFPDSETPLSDVEQFIKTVLIIYNIDTNVTPIFLIGYSLGGTIAFNLAAKTHNAFKGISLIVPFFRSIDHDLYRYQWALKAINYFSPKYPIKSKEVFPKEYQDKYYYIFYDKKQGDITSSRVNSLVMFKNLQDQSQNQAEDQSTPFITFLAGKDQVVQISATQDLIKKVDKEWNKLVVMENSDHISIMNEEDEVRILAMETIAFFDSLL